MHGISPYKVKLEYMKNIINHKEVEEVINNVDVADIFSSVIIWCLKKQTIQYIIVTFL